MVSIGLIHNENADGNKKGKVDISRLENILSRCGGMFLRPKNSDGDIEEALAHIKNGKMQVIASNGGDGTFHRVLNAHIKGELKRYQFLETTELLLPKFLILPSGTANVLAKAVGVDHQSEDALEKVANIEYDKLKTVSVRTLYINCDDTDQFGIIFAAGAVYNFMLEYENSKTGAKCINKAIKMIAKGVVNSSFGNSIVKNTNADLYVNGYHKSGKYAALLACGFKPAIIGIRPFDFMHDLDNETDGFYETHTSAGRAKLIFSLPSLYLGKQLNFADYNYPVQEVRIRGNDIGYTLDGELFKGNDITIEPGPKIKIIKI